MKRSRPLNRIANSYGKWGVSLGAQVLVLSALAMVGSPLHAQDIKHHALSLVGAPQYGPDYKHFDWVNASAPKGGILHQWAQGTFDSLNPFTAKGVPTMAAGLMYDSLMDSSPDEPSVEYCLICEWVSYPEDFSSVTFKLRKRARFHDGQPITPEDVIYSMQAQKKAHPQYKFYYKNVVSAEKTGEREVTFTFNVKGNRELPQIVGQLSILPKHYWEGVGTKGQKRDLSKTTLEVPVGSGPYRVKAMEPGRYITYERVPDYWAKDLPVRIGQWNFDEIKYDYFRDRVPAFEAFKSGDLDVWQETSSKAWATQYNIPAVKKGWIKKEAIPHERVAPMQAFVFNLRKKKFQDIRVRQAFGLAFNFERANKTLFYDQYTRVNSFFGNSELQSKGLPSGRELEILEGLKDLIPAEVFTKEWKNPTAPTQLAHRKNLRKAVMLLKEAGWHTKGGVLRNKDNETFDVEFLLVSPDFERVVLPYTEELKRIGIKARVRLVDTSQYKRRTDNFEYDIIVGTFGQSHSPGNEQRDYWGSRAADAAGSRNLAGIKNKAIDKLIDMIVFAKSREELVEATRALDRVLLWNFYVVPQWHYPFTRLAFWDKFGRPKKVPSQTPALLQTWWYSKEKAVALQKARGK